MAHFARINSDNIVISIHLAMNKDCLNEQGEESEATGIAHLNGVHGGGFNLVQTSYNTCAGEHKLGGTPFRKNYAGRGFTFDEVRDAFIPPQPYDSWTLNEDTCRWDAPTAYPDDGKTYTWNEDTTSWDEVT